ncbi:trihelix transcription factor ASR3-like protein isoform X2 [Cinnamomum micranthum f. kanehirae]|uniref:Trihelix transcription factor ASR3-like protein isoform X2 n=1 Tax=Cinnamomum micranthum f. kanehirae TaxID=337451 RepID=A0A443NTU1_9MAGN|nr:trihelix transcription factor ASR3-like protein isoform X2 [Cinnamomum micranthum f. kanehirae]
MADQSNAVMVLGVAEGETMREYRKGNWTLHEALVLITAKKLDEERRMKKESGGEGRGGRPTELRWKWVEDYCWKNGCMRSQNQCNDKWDNLMRDYKKVRDHEKKVEDGREQSSYWKLERHERKDKNLPTNLLPQIHEALVEVVERRGTQRARVYVPTPNSVEVGLVGEKPISSSMPPSLPLSQHHSSLPTPPQPPSPHAQALATLDSDGSEHSNSSAKRRRKRGEGSSSTGADHELSSAISKSASILSEALLACEEKEERRHRELINVEERKLKIEESKTDISRQAINGLTAAVNKLATSILALASERRNPSAPR